MWHIGLGFSAQQYHPHISFATVWQQGSLHTQVNDLEAPIDAEYALTSLFNYRYTWWWYKCLAIITLQTVLTIILVLISCLT